MKKALHISYLFVLFTLTCSFKQDLSQPWLDWQKDVEKMLFEFMSCGPLTPPNTPCNVYLAKALKRVYGIKDFEKSNGKFLIANEISAYVKVNTDKWTSLGKASSQATLNEAQGYANVGKAVIAVYESSQGTPGHVAMIVPGNLTQSGQWALKCPNSTSFFLNNPSGSYISKPLSAAFKSSLKDSVVIYGRNY